MKRILYILPFVILYLLLCSKSCDNESSGSGTRDQASRTRDSIQLAAEAGELSASALRSYETSAILKLNDFSDYLMILSDTSAGKAFRDKACEMILALFFPPDARISIPGFYPAGITVALLVQEPQFKISRLQFPLFDSLWIKQPLDRITDTSFTGTIGVKFRRHSGNKGTGSNSNNADILLIRRKIVFGHDTVSAWKIFLGGIR